MTAADTNDDTNSTWESLHVRRLDWALRGHTKFLDSLSKEVRDRFARGDEQGEAYVVVFGKTQVGKTTLLLDLMGLEGQALADVSKVLRGGRVHGKSATATAMEYRRSPDPCWRLQDDGQERIVHSDAEMEAALQTVRDRMIRRELQVKRPITVAIPANRFAAGAQAAPAVRMLDLPGDNPADEVEGKHVADMARRYLPHADLILLVGKGDDLSFLRPQGLTLPGIEDWQLVPSRFRIVTTFSYTAQSLLDAARQRQQSGLPIDAPFFRERLLGQIRTFLPQLDGDAANLEHYFPLEFGQSWVDAQQRRPDDPLLACLVPLVTELKQALHRDIADAVTPVARLRSAIDAHVVVGKVKARKLEAFAQTEAMLEGTLGQIDARLDTAIKRHQQQTQTVLKERERHDKAVRAVQDGDTITEKLVQPLHGSTQQHLNRIDSLDTHTSHLLQLMRDFRTDLLMHAGSTLARIEQRLPEFGRIIDDTMADLRQRLSGYWISTYFPSVSDDFKNDKERLAQAILGSASSVMQRIKRDWQQQAQQRCDALEQSCGQAHAVEVVLARAIQQLQDERDASAQALAQLQAERAAASRAMDEDIARCDRFLDTMHHAYGEELQQRRQRILSPAAMPTSAARRFFDLMAAIDLASVHRQVCKQPEPQC